MAVSSSWRDRWPARPREQLALTQDYTAHSQGRLRRMERSAGMAGMGERMLRSEATTNIRNGSGSSKSGIFLDLPGYRGQNCRQSPRSQVAYVQMYPDILV